MRMVYGTLALATIVISSGAFAQEPQSAEEIVQFFARAADLGASRGICVGTEDECKSRQSNAVPTGLDMMINFDLNSAELTPDARRKLAEFTTALKDSRLRSHSFSVEGFTDARGSEKYNLGLSQRRANAVAAFMLADGIENSRIDAMGKGETEPRVADPYDSVNRRVEMRIKLQ